MEKKEFLPPIALPKKKAKSRPVPLFPEYTFEERVFRFEKAVHPKWTDAQIIETIKNHPNPSNYHIAVAEYEKNFLNTSSLVKDRNAPLQSRSPLKRSNPKFMTSQELETAKEKREKMHEEEEQIWSGTEEKPRENATPKSQPRSKRLNF
jgi:hypothetical protein